MSKKTKPSQQSTKGLREAGLRPDFLFCRCENKLEEPTRDKISIFCQVPKSHVVSVHDVSNIYRVPLELREQHIGDLICKRLHLNPSQSPNRVPRRLVPADIESWAAMADRSDALEETGVKEVTIGIVGK